MEKGRKHEKSGKGDRRERERRGRGRLFGDFIFFIFFLNWKI